ncbi:hypothetical protein BLOT_010558 [Blomia tropicalis]|nr:hypothetical protein BLOT_010558 [Blomia tropicalis]
MLKGIGNGKMVNHSTKQVPGTKYDVCALNSFTYFHFDSILGMNLFGLSSSVMPAIISNTIAPEWFTIPKCLYPPLSHPTFDLINQKEKLAFLACAKLHEKPPPPTRMCLLKSSHRKRMRCNGTMSSRHCSLHTHRRLHHLGCHNHKIENNYTNQRKIYNHNSSGSGKYHPHFMCLPIVIAIISVGTTTTTTTTTTTAAAAATNITVNGNPTQTIPDVWFGSDLKLAPNDDDVTYYGPSYVNEGNSLKIICQMSRFRAPKWSHNDHKIDSNRIHYDYLDGTETNRLETITIDNVQYDDSGFYRCNSFSRRAHLVHVIAKHDPNLMLITSFEHKRINGGGDGNNEKNVRLFQVLERENSTIEIDCRLPIDNPNSPDGEYIEGDSRRYSIGSRLIVHNATSLRDLGTYLCRTDHMSGNSRQFGQIIELRAPVKVVPFEPSMFRMVRGQNLTVRCAYHGYPPGTIKWIIGNVHYTNEELKQRLGIELRNDEQDDQILSIEDLNEQHTNTYTCSVSNTITFDEKSFNLHVRGELRAIDRQTLCVSPKVGQTSINASSNWTPKTHISTQSYEIKKRQEYESPMSNDVIISVKNCEIPLRSIGNYYKFTCGIYDWGIRYKIKKNTDVDVLVVSTTSHNTT